MTLIHHAVYMSHFTLIPMEKRQGSKNLQRLTKKRTAYIPSLREGSGLTQISCCWNQTSR